MKTKKKHLHEKDEKANILKMVLENNFKKYKNIIWFFLKNCSHSFNFTFFKILKKHGNPKLVSIFSVFFLFYKIKNSNILKIRPVTESKKLPIHDLRIKLIIKSN